VDPTLSVIIPAYNEERRLPPTLDEIARYLHRAPYASEIIVADDGSEDRTVAVAEEFCRGLPADGAQLSMRILRNRHHGKGYQVRSGMLAARGKYVLFTDADLATPIEEWEKLQPYLEAGDEVVIGSREGMGAHRIGEPRYRHMMGRVFNTIVRLIALGGIHDTQCGFKAFTHAAAQRIFGALRLYGDDAREVRGPAVTAFDVEVLFLARKWGYRIREVPVTWRYQEGTKVDPVADTRRMFADVLKVRWNAMRGWYA
jgi:dolichyl-phosphate beta-glucosyltransferase